MFIQFQKLLLLLIRDGNKLELGQVSYTRNPSQRALFLPKLEPATKTPGSGIAQTRPVGILFTEPNPPACPTDK